MTAIKNAPLIEVMFELQWGEVAPGSFSYSPDEQTLFAGKISAAAESEGFGFTEDIQQPNAPKIPLMVTHRFRRKKMDWPCYQIGLGIFTVNQVDAGYSWRSFIKSLETGLNIFNKADPGKLGTNKNTLSMVLRYQDAFYPDDGVLAVDYLKEHFNLKAGLPDSFLSNENILRNESSINMRINVGLSQPRGEIAITIANASINGVPGLLMETVVESKAKNIFDDVLVEDILSWADDAHKLQQHAFKTFVNPTAYSNEGA